MTEEKSLFRTLCFHLAFWSPIFSYLILSTIIWINDDQWWQWELNSQGFSNYLDIYTLPFSVLASVIPLVVLAATNHRSKQAAENIKLQRQQNLFSNYYKHLEEFEKYVLSRVGDKEKYTRVMHSALFAKMKSDGVPEMWDTTKNTIQACSQKIEALSLDGDYAEATMREVGVILWGIFTRDSAQLNPNLETIYHRLEAFEIICGFDDQALDDLIMLIINYKFKLATFIINSGGSTLPRL